MDLTREQLFALSDAEMLARYRAKHGNPYMPLSMAKKMHRLDKKYAHLGVQAAKRKQEEKEAQQRRLTDLVNNTIRSHGKVGQPRWSD